MKKLHTTIWLLFSLCLTGFSQKGMIRGVIYDNESGETIPFANVLITETGGGFTTDLDGAFSQELPKGTYTLNVSYIGFADQTISEVVVKEDQVNVMDIFLKQDGEILEEVVISAKQSTNTENSVISIQRRSVNVVNGISSQSFRKIGDSNAGSAIKRVTGVSIDGGKYVFVRGLGDRYSKTILNDLEIPGLDPDRNSLQMDIFPTNILDNIIVYKTATAALPGDFTGGIINIKTKDFPEEKKSNISFGMAFNPNMHFNSDYLVSERGQTDFLGFDNGLRDLNLNKYQVIPAPIHEPTLTTITSRFQNNMATTNSTSEANFNFGYSLGNQINKEKVTLGYNAAIGYRNNSTFFEDVQYNNYLKSSDASQMELQNDRTSIGNLGSNSVLLSGMLGGAVKFEKHKFGLTLLHLQNGESKAGLFERNTFIRASNSIIRDNIEYTQSGITNALLSGQHFIDKSFSINWKLSPTFSTIRDKDIRVTPFKIDDDGSLTIEPSEGAQPRRLWRNLDERNLSGKLNFDKTFDVMGKELDVEVGFGNTFKERDYDIFNYLINVKGQTQLDLNGDPNELLSPGNIWTPAKGIGTYVVGNFEPTNTYNATQNILNGFAMADFDLSDKIDANIGIRIEKFTHHYTGQNNTGSNTFDNQKIIDNTNILPSINLVYKLTAGMNLRGSFSQTVARPSFKEASIAQIYDAVSDRTFIGNINLKQTDINNYDLRWEGFGEGGQMFSVSGFYKTFVNPIELVAFSSSAPDDLQPRNVGNAEVAGVEIEFRKNLAFINEDLNTFYLGSNITFVQSTVELDKSLNGEYDSRELNLRNGEALNETRQLQGQSPYIINAYMNFVNLESGWEANFSYNVQGKSLAVVGIGLNPDVYTAPYHDLSCKISKEFGSAKKFRLSAGVKNILNSDKTKLYESYGAQNQIFQQFRPFRTFSLGLSYKFN